MLKLETDTKSLEQALDSVIRRLGSGFQPEMEKVAKEMRSNASRTIQSRGGGNWPALSPRTVEARRRRAQKSGKGPVAGYDAPLQETGELRRSVGVKGAKGNVTEATADEAVIGTDAVQARRLQEGDADAGIPARPFLDITPEDEGRYSRILSRGVKRAVEGEQ